MEGEGDDMAGAGRASDSNGLGKKNGLVPVEALVSPLIVPVGAIAATILHAVGRHITLVSPSSTKTS